MTSNTGVWLEDLTWPEAKARFEAGALVVVPIGAVAKAHGPHLPLKTDAVTARALGQKLLERLPVVVAPVVGFGFYPAFTAFAGSQHLTVPTFTALLSELLGNFRDHHVARLAILNTGVSTEGPVDAAAAGADDLLVLHMHGLGLAADSLLDVAEGGHADERETSVMLAIDPAACAWTASWSMARSSEPAPPAIRHAPPPSRVSASWRLARTTLWRQSVAAAGFVTAPLTSRPRATSLDWVTLMGQRGRGRPASTQEGTPIMADITKLTSNTLIAAERVEGTDVYNLQGDKLGTVDDIMIDKVSGKAIYAVMSFGGFLGIGEKYHPLPWSTLKYDETKGGYVVNLDKKMLEGAPTYDMDEEFLWTPDYGRRVDKYYNAPTFW